MTYITRRTLLVGAATLATLPPVARAYGVARTAILFAGTYDSENGGGIYPVLFDPVADSWRLGEADRTIGNASFAVYDSFDFLYYMVDEQEDGAIGAYRYDLARQGFTKLGIVPSKGAAPCYLAVDGSGTRLAVANYTTGNVVFYSIDPLSGMPLSPVVRQNAGHGPNPQRQSGPHAHCVKFTADGTMAYSVDLGTDEVLGYRLKSDTVGQAFTALKMPPGSGPRHLVFHPDGEHAYLVCELASTISTLRRKSDGRFELLDSFKTFPEERTAVNYTGHVAINAAGSRVYVSNRGDDSLAVYSVGPDKRLTLLQLISCGGVWPRHFTIMEDHNRLVCANQISGNLTIFELGADGLLTDTGQRLLVPQAVFLGRVQSATA